MAPGAELLGTFASEVTVLVSRSVTPHHLKENQ